MKRNSIFIALFLSAITTGFSRDLPLPIGLRGKNIFHEETSTIAGFSCGYNALFGACQFEHNRYRDPLRFAQFVDKYLHTKRLNSIESSDFNVLRDLSLRLGLKNIHFLSLDNGKVELRLETPSKVRVSVGTPEYMVEKLLEQESQRRQNLVIQKIQRECAKTPRGRVYQAHFICRCFVGDWHGILVSLVKDRTGQKSLYILDILNHLITPKSDITRHLNYLSAAFHV